MHAFTVRSMFTDPLLSHVFQYFRVFLVMLLFIGHYFPNDVVVVRDDNSVVFLSQISNFKVFLKISPAMMLNAFHSGLLKAEVGPMNC